VNEMTVVHALGHMDGAGSIAIDIAWTMDALMVENT